MPRKKKTYGDIDRPKEGWDWTNLNNLFLITRSEYESLTDLIREVFDQNSPELQSSDAKQMRNALLPILQMSNELPGWVKKTRSEKTIQEVLEDITLLIVKEEVKRRNREKSTPVLETKMYLSIGYEAFEAPIIQSPPAEIEVEPAVKLDTRALFPPTSDPMPRRPSAKDLFRGLKLDQSVVQAKNHVQEFTPVNLPPCGGEWSREFQQGPALEPKQKPAPAPGLSNRGFEHGRQVALCSADLTASRELPLCSHGICTVTSNGIVLTELESVCKDNVVGQVTNFDQLDYNKWIDILRRDTKFD